MRNLGCLLATVALLVACGPTEELGPDAGEEVDASLDNALVEGEWAVSMQVTGCSEDGGGEFTWQAPSFDVEVESDGDIVTTCAGCETISVTVGSLQNLHVELTQIYNGGSRLTITIDATDDGITAHASAHFVTESGSCDATDADADVTRRRE